jgi:hypothetical protein
MRASAKEPANEPYGVVGGLTVEVMLPNAEPKTVSLFGTWKFG